MSRTVLSQINCNIRKCAWSITRVLKPFKDRGVPCWGLCDFGLQSISVAKRRRKRDEFKVLVHEIMHAMQPDLSEDAVEAMSESLTAVLFDKLGCRLEWP